MKFIRSHPVRAVIGTLLLLIAIFYFSDPLNRFAIGMFFDDITGANWKNGLCTWADLPISASPKEILTKSYGSRFFQILETKKFWLPSAKGDCWAVRYSKDGDKERLGIILLYFEQLPYPPHPDHIGRWTIKFYQ